LKSLYYCRSKSIQRAEVIATKEDMPEGLRELIAGVAVKPKLEVVGETTDYDECLACQ